MKSLLLFAFLNLGSYSFAAVCQLPEHPGQGVRESVRKTCLQNSLFTLTAPSVIPADVTMGPPGKVRYSSEDVIYCRFFARDQGGSSTKFRCYRTDENNQLYNNKGELILAAVSVGRHDTADEDILFDAQGNVLKNKKGKPEKAEVLKVRYSDGTERNRENYTSALAGHMAWILGLPAERFYPVTQVQCFGCKKNPFKEKQTRPANGEKNSFLFATLEKKFDGSRIMKVAGHAVAWKWTDFTPLYPHMRQDQKISYEELVLAANLFHIVEERGSQHALVCDDASVDPATRTCGQPLAIIHDLGAAFGNRSLKTVAGAKTMNHPRGDYAAYQQVKMFRNPSTCELTLKAGGLRKVSEDGRRAFAQRLERLTPDLLAAAIKASHYTQADASLRTRVARRENLSGAVLDQRIEQLWSDLIFQKINEIKAARCP